MLDTLKLRLPALLAAALATTLTLRVTAAEPGPQKAETTTPT